MNIETLPYMIDKLSINENIKQKVTSKLNQDFTVQEKMEYDFKPKKASFYDIDNVSSKELQASLCRIKENPREPFSFLTNISDEYMNDKRLPTKPTEIDMQLAAVVKRIESSKILLEEAKSYVEDIYLRAKQNDIRQLWKVYDGKE
ncbi:uncharacterized protein LOC105428959 [Pogonomyrmex barbatus]|uniref:Uncharacterized protein LOC105428959 n=1 Tax=Pogonomyrmex barbatus TaxID=144034 RepID=A0A6I9WBZ3_9HYME|nr:uncharacterized protein LOC105428959 [Pogonomyrmex barbatus]